MCIIFRAVWDSHPVLVRQGCEATLPVSSGFFPYDGYYTETGRTGTVQKTIPSSQRPPPITMMYIPTRLGLHACISRHFGWQSARELPSSLAS